MVTSKCLILGVFAIGLGLASCTPQNTEQDETGRGGRARRDKDVDPLTQKKRDLREMIEEIDRVLESRDWVRAKQQIQKGIELASDLDPEIEVRKADLQKRLGDVELARGQENVARRHYTDAMAVFRLRGNIQGQFRVFRAFGLLEERRGDYSAAARQYKEAKALLPQIEDTALLGNFQGDLGRLEARKLNRTAASKHYIEAIRLFDVAGDKRSRAQTYLVLAAEEDALDKVSESRRSLQKAVDIFRSIEDTEGEVKALHRMASMAVREKNYRTARRLFKKVHGLYVKLDNQTQASKVMRQLSSLPQDD